MLYIVHKGLTLTSPLHPASCQSVHLHFIPFRDRYNSLELVQLFDNETGAVTSLRDVLEVYVRPQEEAQL